MKSDLSNICFYAKGKVDVETLTKENFISTENMKPNKGGIVKAASLPSTIQTQSYRKGDVLVSNIRPYFKKIWFAKESGGCSNDILILRAKEGIVPQFLYYVLSDDAFFNYATATAKGTKMPRGDKTAIMQYQVPVYDRKTQDKIASLLGDIDAKIEVNQKINDNLSHAMSLAKQRRYQPSGARSRKAVYRWCFIGRMPDSSRLSRERSLAA